MTARLVIEALVEELRMTCRKGWSIVGASKVLISRQTASSLLSLENAESRGLSCTGFALLLRSPNLLARLESSSDPGNSRAIFAILFRSAIVSIFGAPALELLLASPDFSAANIGPGPPPSLPPKMAETELCAQRACLRIAEVIVIHSCVIRAIGFMRMLTFGRESRCSCRDTEL